MIEQFRRSLWLLVISAAIAGARADGPGIPNQAYASNDVYRSLGKFLPKLSGSAHSAVGLHRGYLFAPYSFDHGGGFRGYNTGGIQFLDLSSPTNPVIVFDTWDFQSTYYNSNSAHYLGEISEVHAINLWNDYAALSLTRDGGRPGFAIVNLAPFYNGTGNPLVAGRLYWNDITADAYNGYSFKPAWHSGRYIYAPLGTYGLRIVDASNPAAPVEVARFNTSQIGNYQPRAATVQGNLLFMHDVQLGTTDNQAGLYDISNPTNPVVLNRFAIDNAFYDVTLAGTWIWNAAEPLTVYDVSNPANPILRMLDSNPGFSASPEYITLSENKLFVGTVDGVVTYRLQHFTNAILETSWIAPGPHPGGPDYAFSNPMGNLLVQTSDHSGNGSHILAHQGTPDTTSPAVLSIHPRAGATNLPITSRFGISFSEGLDVRTISSNTFYLKKAAGGLVPGRFNFVNNILNFWPDQLLQTNQTYEIVVPVDGVADYAGNSMSSEFRAAFSTGSQIIIPRLEITASGPGTVGQNVSLSARLAPEFAGLIPGPYQWSWNFGDGAQTSGSSNATHTYSLPRDYVITVTMQFPGGQISGSTVQIVHLPITATAPSRSSTIVCDTAAGVVWNVNPDNDSVSAINAVTLAKLAEIPVGDEPRSLALGPGGELWVANAGSATITVIDRAAYSVKRVILLDRGSRPASVIFNPSLTEAYVSLEDTGEVLWFSPGGSGPKKELYVCPKPFGLAASVDGRLLVTRFVSPETAGELYVVNTATAQVITKISLPKSTEPDGLTQGRGLPNYLGHPAISPDGTTAFIPGKKDNIDRGVYRDGLPLDHDNTVRSIGIKIDLNSNTEAFAERKDLDDMDLATAAAYDPYGNLAFFTTLGSHNIIGVDVHAGERTFNAHSGGRSPIGLALDAGRGRLFVHNFMSRSVSALNAADVLSRAGLSMPLIGSTTVVANEALPPAVLRGKQLFYEASDGRLSTEGYMSCASCHFGGGSDGRVWDLTGFGEGVRNTIDLRGHGLGHGPRHWSANFDEVQDFEQQVRSLNEATGFLEDEVFALTSHPLSQLKAGRDSDLDALAAYVNSLIEMGASPHRNPDGTLTASAAAGRVVFTQAGCATCHSGAAFSDSWTGARHQVGTLTAASGNRLGGALDGLDTPTLRGLWRTAPYLHDGSAPTLRDVLVTRNPTGQHASLAGFSTNQINDLIDYLLQIDDHEPESPSRPIALFSPQETVINGTVAVEVRFTEAITGLTTSDFVISNGIVTDLFGTGNLYTLIVAPVATGAITIRLASNSVVGASGPNSEGILARLHNVDADSFRVPQTYRYVRLTGLAGHNDFVSAAEINLRDESGNLLPRVGWSVAGFSSEDLPGEPGVNVLDGLNSTMWHSRWSSSRVYPPQYIDLNLGAARQFSQLVYLPRQDGNLNGTITQYQVHGSTTGSNWVLLASGTWADTPAMKQANLTNNAALRRHYRLVADVDRAGTRNFRGAEIELRNPSGAIIPPSHYAISATSAGPGSSVAFLSDNQNSTVWRSVADPSQPVVWVFTFNAATNVGAFRYTPEQDGNPLGDLRVFRFYSSEDGVVWDLVANGELTGAIDAQQIVTMIGGGASSMARPNLQNDFVALRALALAQEPLAANFNELPSLPGYERWALLTMPTANSVLRSQYADPDNDRYANLLEWLFGGNPNLAEVSLPGELQFSIGTNGYMQLDGGLATHVDTFYGELEVSTDLQSWAAAGTNALWQISTTPDGAGMLGLQIRHPIPPSEQRQFLRTGFRTQ